jgi:hypothetical protein
MKRAGSHAGQSEKKEEAMNTAQAGFDLINLAITDWDYEDGKKGAKVTLDGVSRNATIGEVLGEAVRAMGLPFASSFQAVFRGRQLARTQTLQEIGIESGERLEVLPEVSAG